MEPTVHVLDIMHGETAPKGDMHKVPRAHFPRNSDISVETPGMMPRPKWRNLSTPTLSTPFECRNVTVESIHPAFCCISITFARTVTPVARNRLIFDGVISKVH